VRLRKDQPINSQLTMRLLHNFLLLVLVASGLVSAASWGFEDGTVAVSGKATGAEAAIKEK